MLKPTHHPRTGLYRLILPLMIVGCQGAATTISSPVINPSLQFDQVVIDTNGIAFERAVGDLDGDGHNDVIAMDETTLRCFTAPDFTPQTLVTLNPSVHGWPNFRADDMRLADFDADGDLDIVTRIGDSGDVNGQVVWFENPRPSTGITGTWNLHVVGSCAYVKDIGLADFDRDGKLDIVTREHERTRIWFQNNPNDWYGKAIDHPAHEGMAVGDLDGDGDPDVVLNGFWLQTPSNARTGTYQQHTIDDMWFTDQSEGEEWQHYNCKVATADVDRNGHVDVLLSNSELPGYPVLWYSASDPINGPWTAHEISPEIGYCHNLQPADFDGDGDIDVLAGGMVESDERGLSLFLQTDNAGDQWTEIPIQTLGSYSAIIGDIDDDQDLDIIGVRAWNEAPTEIWRNHLLDNIQPTWRYTQVDDSRAAWGDFNSPTWLRYFGLGWGDIDNDGYLDLVSGRYAYFNPGGDMTGIWTRRDYGFNVDALLAVDVDGDGRADVIGTRGSTVYWIKADNSAGTSWTSIAFDYSAPSSSHINPQGYALADLEPGDKPEIVISNGDEIYYYRIPTSNPQAGSWPRVRICTESNSEGFGVADIDGDGFLDIAAIHLPSNAGSTGPRDVKWLRNPGNGGSDWEAHILGQVPATYPDRVAAADFTGDGRPDVVVTEEIAELTPTASTYWFEAPENPTNTNWTRRLLVTQHTTNSMDVCDIDHDGDTDIILCEHRAEAGDQELSVWQNDGSGQFVERVVDKGKEGHLGARVADLDQDGDFEIINIAWDDYPYLHLWRTDFDLIGDLNGDCSVNLTDLAILLSHYGETSASYNDGDLDGDGVINLNDLGMLLRDYGSGC